MFPWPGQGEVQGYVQAAYLGIKAGTQVSSQCQGKEAGLDSHEVGGVASWVPCSPVIICSWLALGCMLQDCFLVLGWSSCFCQFFFPKEELLDT